MQRTNVTVVRIDRNPVVAFEDERIAEEHARHLGTVDTAYR